jgi:hypothetical protein
MFQVVVIEMNETRILCLIHFSVRIAVFEIIK